MNPDAVPDAPFKTSWHELALRRMVRWAAENGFDRIAWTTGEQQAERYDLSKRVSRIALYEQDGKLSFSAWKPDGSVAIDLRPTTKEDLPDLIGKEAAEKLLNAKPDRRGARTLSGIDLKVGGEGMKGFYDKILPAYADKFGKPFGAKVGETTIGVGGGSRGKRVYEGPEHSAEAVVAAARRADVDVRLRDQLQAVAGLLRQGVPFRGSRPPRRLASGR